jgi:hypothetical protein
MIAARFPEPIPTFPPLTIVLAAKVIAVSAMTAKSSQAPRLTAKVQVGRRSTTMRRETTHHEGQEGFFMLMVFLVTKGSRRSCKNGVS